MQPILFQQFILQLIYVVIIGIYGKSWLYQNVDWDILA